MEIAVLRTPKVEGANAAAEERRVAVIRSFMVVGVLRIYLMGWFGLVWLVVDPLRTLQEAGP